MFGFAVLVQMPEYKQHRCLMYCRNWIFLKSRKMYSGFYIVIILYSGSHTNKFQQTSMHSKFIGFLTNKESITKSVFSLTKHLQINNLHISTIVFHFRHILFLHDLMIHFFFPFHMFNRHLAKGLSLSLVHDSGINSLLIPETRLLYQYSVPGSKHISSKLCSLPRLFPIFIDCLPGF